MNSLIILSGGMDSTTALAYSKNKGLNISNAVHFQYGSKHNAKELIAAHEISKIYKLKLRVISLEFINQLFKSDLLKSGSDVPEGHYEDPSMKRTVVPFRNGIMLSIASGLAESLDADSVILGNHAGDHAIYPDCREDFVTAMGSAIALGTYKKIKLESPFVKMSKSEIVALGSLINVPYEHTWSCYKGGQKHCGKCGTCYERIEAFQKAGVKDPTVYE
jgi:7-cyano-7-deazaguanine synthase